MSRAASRYQELLVWCLQRRWRVVLSATALFAGGGLLELLLFVPLLWLALSAQRHLTFFVFAATPFVAAGAMVVRARVRRKDKDLPLDGRPETTK